MPVFTLIILIALAILGFYAIRRSSSHNESALEDKTVEHEQMPVESEGSESDGGERQRTGREAAAMPSMYAGDLGDYQKEETELAVRVAREKFGKELDFSHRSVADVESILSGAHDYTTLAEAKDVDYLSDWAEMFGCYLATVIQKQTGEGELARDHEDMGDDRYPFHWRGKTLFLQSWCHRRIFDGPTHDVCQLYRAEILDSIYSPPTR